MQTLDILKESPSQTAGPYVHIGCVPNFCGITGVYPHDLGDTMVNADTQGARITVRGTVYDGTGTPLRDAMVEIWQADANGIYPNNDPRGPADPNFTCGSWRVVSISGLTPACIFPMPITVLTRC